MPKADDGPDIADLLYVAGYRIAPVPTPIEGIGCDECGDPDATTLNGRCIKCAFAEVPIRRIEEAK